MSLSKLGATFAKNMRSQNSESVTYTRGALTGTVSATLAERSADVIGEDQVIVQIRNRDFIINVSDLILDGSQVVEPAVGDVIIFDGDNYEVILGDDRAWRYHDRHNLSYRIHTKQVV